MSEISFWTGSNTRWAPPSLRRRTRNRGDPVTRSYACVPRIARVTTDLGPDTICRLVPMRSSTLTARPQASFESRLWIGRPKIAVIPAVVEVPGDVSEFLADRMKALQNAFRIRRVSELNEQFAADAIKGPFQFRQSVCRAHDSGSSPSSPG